MSPIESVLNSMPGISLSEMDSIRLMNRVDSKYLTDDVTLGTILSRAASCGYRVFEEGGCRLQSYETMYLDTPARQMYLDHHNRRLVRQKVRTRRYASGLTFLELKSKNNHGRTRKKRMEIAGECYGCAALGEEQLAWLDGKLMYGAGDLSPALETRFSRITLVDPQMTERSTIDLNVTFGNLRNGKSFDMRGIVIIEVKQDSSCRSHMRDILLECRVKPVRVSKYCIGTALTDESVRRGRFKMKTRTIQKMMKPYD